MTEERDSIERPRLRPTVDLLPFEHEGRSGFLLRDALAGDRMLFVAPEALALLVLLDGQRTIRDIQTVILQQTGQILPSADIEAFVRLLDEHLLLDGPRYEAWLADQAAAYAALPARPSLAQSMGLPADAGDLRRLLDAVMERHAPHPPDTDSLPARISGLVAPHIDLERGQKTYAIAYRALGTSPPADVYIILGVNHHFLSENPFIATDRPYQNPLGRLPVDERLLAALQQAVGWNLLQDQVAHRSEHSIEFPALFLRYLYPDAPISIVPLLCNFMDPEDRRVIAMIAALREVLRAAAGEGRRVVVIASVDFSHIGPQFGWKRPVEKDDLLDVGRRDRETLKALAAGMPEAFWDDIMADRNARHIDALHPCYVFLRILAPCSGTLLHYEQAWNPRNTVTFAALAF
ncbi:MAG: AmmeMemoRadiSam system protein B [Candidatus Sumerlaeia bacterium]